MQMVFVSCQCVSKACDGIQENFEKSHASHVLHPTIVLLSLAQFITGIATLLIGIVDCYESGFKQSSNFLSSGVVTVIKGCCYPALHLLCGFFICIEQ